MKTGIVIHKRSYNYGDDIQSYAAYKLMNEPDLFLDRENLNKVDGDEEIKLLCNGWFMENPENWPPADIIKPLFISMHISHNNNADKLMISKELVSYYKKHEPIGCRDYHTVKLFEKIGVKAYYSGCLTLTLKNDFGVGERSDEILFVDAFNKNFPEELRDKYYKQLVPQSVQPRVKFIKHSHNNPNMTDVERLKSAEQLLKRYAQAHLVVTSRIHCALPSIAMGTPVLFLDVGFNIKNSRNRFPGITEYFNQLNNDSFPFSGISPVALLFRRGGLYKYYFNGKKIDFDWDNPPNNPVDIKPLANTIRKTVNDFFLDKIN